MVFLGAVPMTQMSWNQQLLLALIHCLLHRYNRTTRYNVHLRTMKQPYCVQLLTCQYPQQWCKTNIVHSGSRIQMLFSSTLPRYQVTNSQTTIHLDTVDSKTCNRHKEKKIIQSTRTHTHSNLFIFRNIQTKHFCPKYQRPSLQRFLRNVLSFAFGLCYAMKQSVQPGKLEILFDVHI